MAPLSPVLLFSLLLLLLPKTCAETFSVSSEDDLDNALSEGEIYLYYYCMVGLLSVAV